jgi:hypothetical protein
LKGAFSDTATGCEHRGHERDNNATDIQFHFPLEYHGMLQRVTGTWKRVKREENTIFARKSVVCARAPRTTDHSSISRCSNIWLSAQIVYKTVAVFNVILLSFPTTPKAMYKKI